MKKIVLSCLIATAMLHAESDKEFKLGISSLSFDYNEYDDNGKWLDSETSDFSDIFGVSIALKDRFGRGIFGNTNYMLLKTSYHAGKTKYDGHLQTLGSGSLTPYSTKTDETLLQTELRVADEIVKDKLNASYFVGLGYRNWTRDSSKDQYGYKEIYAWKYWNSGVNVSFKKIGKFDIGLELAYQSAISPEMRAYIYGGLDFELGATNGYRLEMPVRYNFNEKQFIELAGGYDYWKINKSNSVPFSSGGSSYTAYEPKSETKNKYIDLSFGIKF